MRYPKEEIEKYRKDAGELENELIDEFNAGTLTRGDLIKRGTYDKVVVPDDADVQVIHMISGG